MGGLTAELKSRGLGRFEGPFRDAGVETVYDVQYVTMCYNVLQSCQRERRYTTCSTLQCVTLCYKVAMGLNGL
jgi:hypothetical protein